MCALRVAVIASLCAALLLLATIPAQPAPPSAQMPAEICITEKVAELEKEVIGLRKESEQLRKQVEGLSTPKTLWGEVAPWIALALVGIGFARAWAVTACGKPAECTLKELQGQLDSTNRDVRNLDSKITAVKAMWDLIWSRTASGRDRDPRA